MRRRRRPREGEDFQRVVRVSRDNFLTKRWRYQMGEHVTMLAPTQNGKTTTGIDLLNHIPREKNNHPPVMLVMKPRDATVTKGIKKLGYRTIRTWPPLPKPWDEKRGYALWPKHTFNLDRDDAHLKEQFQKALTDAYRRGNTIVFADETYGLLNELGLHRQVTGIHSRGAGMGTGIWCLTQKPTHIGTWAYSQAEHLFLGRDPDKRARERFAEIGGVDPDLIKHYVSRLGKYEWLYIKRSGHTGDPDLCIIERK